MKTTPILLATAALSVGGYLAFNSPTHAAKLLPFQGRLTDASGAPVADGAKVVQFKIYDAPTGGTAVWNGEVQKVTVNGGLVSTLLGSKTDLSAVDFNQALYLEITVDANADNQITAADPPLLPRQSILPAVFAVEAQSARDSQKLGGFNWNAVFDNGNPATGNIPANRVSFPAGALPASVIAANNSIAANQLAPDSVDTSEIKDNAVTTSKIAAGSVTTIGLANGAITAAKLSADVTTPAGAVVAYIGDTAPTGWLLCDGSEVNRVGTYANLAIVVGTRFGTAADPVNKFKLPDLRGYFLRGVDGAAGRDPDKTLRTFMATGGATGNAVGSVQGDAFQGHHHALYYRNDSPGFSASGPGASGILILLQNQEANNTAGPTKAVKEPTTDGTHGPPRVSNETRPANAYVNYIIKY